MWKRGPAIKPWVPYTCQSLHSVGFKRDHEGSAGGDIALSPNKLDNRSYSESNITKIYSSFLFTHSVETWLKSAGNPAAPSRAYVNALLLVLPAVRKTEIIDGGRCKTSSGTISRQ